MKLIRKLTAETVQLEDGFLWSDEFDWKPKEQDKRYAVNGALIIQEGTKQAGRPITLTAEDRMGWISRADLKTIQNWSVLSEEFTLEFEYPHDTRQFNVIFNHQDGAIDAKPVKGHPTISDNEFYKASLRFTEVPNAD